MSLAGPRDPDTFTQALPVLDTGAEVCAFDGTVLLALGWPEDEIAARARDTRPIGGIALSGPPLTGYLHDFLCYIDAGRRFATLQIEAFVTPPNTLSVPVLGRRGFLDQVDFCLSEKEQQIALWFRDQSALQDAYPDSDDVT